MYQSITPLTRILKQIDTESTKFIKRTKKKTETEKEEEENKVVRAREMN